MNTNINLDLLKTFYAVAKNKNITKACEELLVSQSAVSKAIKNIENQLDCKLFIRSKKGVELTKEGKILFESTEKILSILDNDLEKITKTNTIHILTGKVLFDKIVFPYIELFKKKYPNSFINLGCMDINGILKSLKNQEVDIAIGYYIDNINDSYEQIKISEELHPILVCNNSYKELLNREIDIHELEKYPFIISAKGATAHNYAINFFKENNLNITPSMEVKGTSLITQLVEKGLGISILTEEFIKEELDNKKIYKIQLKEELEPRYLYMQTYKNRTFSKETSYLINLLKNEKRNQ